MATILIIVGVGGSLFFATHLKTSPQLYISGKSVPAAGQTAVISQNGSILASQLKQKNKLDLVKPVAAKVRPKTKLPLALARSDPLRIRIPSIQVDTSLLPVGLSQAGAIAMPDVFDQAGWYDQSPTPGERGPAVIVGHVDSPHGIAVFWNLRELLPGDIIQVDRQDNTTATFKVTGIEQFPQGQFPTQMVYGNVDYAGIRLITCGGTFNTLTRHYNLDTVVFGSLLTV